MFNYQGSVCCALTSQLRHNIILTTKLSRVFLKFFRLFLKPQYLYFFQPHLTKFSLIFHKILPTIFIQFYGNRRRRDSNPRAAINDLLPFQGSPFGQLGYFSISIFRFKMSVGQIADLHILSKIEQNSKSFFLFFSKIFVTLSNDQSLIIFHCIFTA